MQGGNQFSPLPWARCSAACCGGAWEEAERLFQRLRGEGVHLFYVKTPVEFGSIGDLADPAA
jgi:hypothetical protein